MGHISETHDIWPVLFQIKACLSRRRHLITAWASYSNNGPVNPPGSCPLKTSGLSRPTILSYLVTNSSSDDTVGAAHLSTGMLAMFAAVCRNLLDRELDIICRFFRRSALVTPFKLKIKTRQLYRFLYLLR